jgi:hypothetical protein
VLIGRTEKRVSILEGRLIKVYDPCSEPLSSIEIEWECEGESYELELAARCAVASWFVFESQQEEAIKPPKILDNEWFSKKWCGYWNVCRNSYKESRQELLGFLGRARLQLLAPELNGDGAYQVVDRLMCEAKQYNWQMKDGKREDRGLESLVSKFAFTCRPTLFVPRDSLALETLRRRGHHDCADNYAAYMRAFLREEARISAELLRRRMTAERFSCHGIMPQRLFQMRAADWYHLLDSKKFSFDKGKVKDCDWVGDYDRWGRTAGAIHLGRLEN